MTEEDLAKIEKQTGLELPGSYRVVVLDYPSELLAPVPRQLFCDAPERELLNSHEKIIELNREVRSRPNWEDGGPWPDDYFVFGYDGGGAYYAIDIDYDYCDSVFYWDYEEERFEEEFESIDELVNFLIEYRSESGFALPQSSNPNSGPASSNRNPTTLEDAISNGDLNAVQALLANGVNVNQKNADGMDLLSHAQVCQQFDIAQKLLESGANVNGDETFTPLQAAIDNGANDLILKLIESGADVNLKGTETDSYPIHLLAWEYFDPIFFKAMISAGADATLTDGAGQTAHDLMLENLSDNPGDESAIREILELLSAGQSNKSQ